MKQIQHDTNSRNEVLPPVKPNELTLQQMRAEKQRLAILASLSTADRVRNLLK
jgi:hypothetical protein